MFFVLMSNTLACNTNVWFLCLCSIEHRAYIYVDVHYIGLNERWCFRLWPGICMFNVMCPNREIFRNEVNVLFVCNDLFFFAYFLFLFSFMHFICYLLLFDDFFLFSSTYFVKHLTVWFPLFFFRCGLLLRVTNNHFQSL